MSTKPAQHEALLRLDREEVLKLEKSLSREWLCTNGLGGFASSTLLSCATRRYHGLLVTPFAGTVQRHVFLSRFEETLHGEGREEALSMARYDGCFAPSGHRSIESFELCPWPRTSYRIGDLRVIREVLMPPGRAAVLVRYRFEPTEPLQDAEFSQSAEQPQEFRLRPLLACRAADALTVENLALDPRVRRRDGVLGFQPYAALPELMLSFGDQVLRFEADPLWYQGVEYRSDIERGYAGHEDLFAPGVIHVDLHQTSDFLVAASIDAAIEDPHALWEAATAAALAEGSSLPCLPNSETKSKTDSRTSCDVRSSQMLAAKDFLYQDEHGRQGVVAGWPWFLEWGRDSFIALPGLTVGRGQLELFGEVLEGALPWLKDGLFPNIYGRGQADSHYGSVDASLWFARAVRLYENAGGAGIAERFLPALREIACAYRDGACGFVEADASGLIKAGRPDLNATWMDARASDGPVTPRDGFAVEINGLWCFLLRYLEILEQRAGYPERAHAWAGLRRRAYRSFMERFWLDEQQYLADAWKDGVADARVRPNMVLAAALEFSPLTRIERQAVLAVTERDLLTPRGLRTLAPDHKDYQGRYCGDQDRRDRAYHQGTVWPWLLGSYVETALRAHGKQLRRVAQLRALLDGFQDHLLASGLLQISEVFDGDPPHRPGGTIAQAWSCAEILRGYALLDEEAALWEKSDRPQEDPCGS